jgi:protein-S-isoprenylcysteine O-methyltransferase Ste14
VNPYQPTTAIVTEGPYRFTRNPIYLSLAVLYAGLAVMANALWSLLLLAVMLIIHYAVILPEERYLEQKFGEEYRSYKAKVRRWL